MHTQNRAKLEWNSYGDRNLLNLIFEMWLPKHDFNLLSDAKKKRRGINEVSSLASNSFLDMYKWDLFAIW